MVCYALTYSFTLLMVLVYRMWCVGAVIDGKKALTRVEEILLQEYRMQVARKLTAVESSRDFLRIFVPNNEIEPRFTSMVNETVQKKNKGRFFNQGRALDFDEEISTRAMDAWIAHGASVGCLEPQPKMLDMFVELNISRGIGTYIYPSCTWVRRCGGSGCCPSDLQECASVPGTRTNVTKPFVMIAEMGIDETSHVTVKDQFLNYTFYEDTACACRNRPEGELPCSHKTCPSNQGFSVATCGCKCRKDCPAPYIQNPESCECECGPGDRRCLKVMRGKTQLRPSECLCVGHGCEQPKCRRHWSFSISRCRCEERAPPPVRGRILPNEVPVRGRMLPNKVPVDTSGGTTTAEVISEGQLDVEVLNEYTSGMAPPLTSAETTTIIITLSPEEEKEEDNTEGDSSSSSVDEKEPDPIDPSVQLPHVAPEQRYIGGRVYQEVQTESRTRVTELHHHTRATEATIGELEESTDSRIHLEQGANETTSIDYETSSQTTERPETRIISHRGRFHHQSRVGLEDDEDEAVVDQGEFGSGSTPMDREE